MFKELGEFIDIAGRSLGIVAKNVAKKLLSKDEPQELHGILIDDDPFGEEIGIADKDDE